MKTLLVIAFLLPTVLFAQQTYVPDDNFEQALIDFGLDEGELNDSVPTANLKVVTHLNVASKSIDDLTGIEDFKVLVALDCENNYLLKFDVSSLTMLKYINCKRNSLIELDVSYNTNLKILDCPNNYITALDLSKNPQLEDLICTNNSLSELNLKNGNNLNISMIKVQGNNLNCIQVDDSVWSTNNSNWRKDYNTVYSENCLLCMEKMTYISDDNFEQALIDLGVDDGALNDSVPTAKLQGVRGLNISNKAISDLTGIEDMINLIDLDCSYNNITELNLANNTSLLWLNSMHNSITDLNLNSQKDLGGLNCSHNNISELDLTNNKKLQDLDCSFNSLTNCDISKNRKLIRILCSDNPNLINLNLQNGINIILDGKKYGIAVNAKTNPNLFCIQVDDSAWSANHDKWLKDDQAVYSEDCSTVGIDQYLLDTDISIFPNPASNTFVIRFELESPQAVSLSLSDLSGNVLQEFLLTNAMNVNDEIDVSQLPSGVYFLNVSIGDKTVSKKVIIE